MIELRTQGNGQHNLIAPSLLAANFANLENEMEWFNRSEADWLHLDVMDGVFVPNISFGFPVMESVARLTTKPLDVHLMIVQPEKFISQVRDLGAALMNVHQEACVHLHRTVQQIHEAGMRAAVTLNPATPVSTLEEIIGDVDVVMLMTVNPGFGAQKFITHSLDKVKRLRELISRTDSKALIEVDGGVNRTTAPLLRDAGVDVYVTGSAVFGKPDPAGEVSALKGLTCRVR
ncbi:MAG: ribulose-phosphate 3-epimerase [Bacteroidales bacterium]|nr:ribulose-phosphate 3-epimerase [Bacteroidales bacterium]